MTTGGSKIRASPTSSTIDWKVDRSPISGMNCLGRLSRDSGQTRVPEPPHMMTGWILIVNSPVMRRHRARVFRLKTAVKATSRLYALVAARASRAGEKAAMPAQAAASASAKAAKASGQGKALRDRSGRKRGGQAGQRAEQRRRGKADCRLRARTGGREGEAARHDGAGADADQGEAGDAQRQSRLRRRRRRTRPRRPQTIRR